MFIVFLRFTENKNRLSDFMEGHNQWIGRGFEDGVFLMVGSLQPGPGGCVIAHGISRETLVTRVNEDPFVVENIVSVEIIELDPKQTDERLSFLMN